MGTINWKAAIWAGIIAALIFLMLEMIMVPLFLGGSPWAPPRMIAAIILGEGVLPPPATFDFGVLMAALVLHLVLSISYTLAIAFLINNMALGKALAVGAVIGLIIYFVNFYIMTSLFPWFAMARNWVSAVAHVSFGIAAAWAYLGLLRHSAYNGHSTAKSI
ncbi:hypothetical protein H9Q13_06670 [Pontibacter sp. JH31]|uniref:Sodium:proline symporter n=1 Tax=Pontibacter aquaedesilientis TaxID=2766980 RepID=A0ABR7XEY0_9BACT|nr:hypothetical protein [Pontibacter aquaedesilientis]MBD1396842.1 hypothetical protein [Pontibacter aquaedesilientis]